MPPYGATRITVTTENLNLRPGASVGPITQKKAAAYAGRLRVSELVVKPLVLSFRVIAGGNDPVFASRKGSGRLTERAISSMVKRTANAAGINEDVSSHWLRHAHDSHAIERGASLPEV
jgi:integrase